MTQKSRIFVHGLKAHADDMWACGLLIASKPDTEFTEIIRDAKRVNEAADNDFVLDCGMKFDGVRFFDHHQFESTDDVDCAFSLIAKTFAPWVLTDEKFGPVVERVRVQDNFGIAAAEKKFGNADEWIVSESVLTELFEKEPLKIAKILAEGFVKRLSDNLETKEAEAWIRKNTRIELLENGINVLVCDTSPFKEGFSIIAYNAASSRYINEKKIEVAYGWNGDGSDARTLFRTKLGEKSLDFTKSDPNAPVFCHNSGFLLVFNPSDDCEYRKLVFQAAGSEKNLKNSDEFSEKPCEGGF
ncbi:MYG1 family protein [bacterium]|nr:MYG1 family protein [bacterium]MBP5434418.1 MYG1 family protein [bacterium]